MKTITPWPSEPGTFLKARFLRRPNRFLVHCVNDQLGEIHAHLPNPGRLWELFLPGAILYLKPAEPSREKGAVERKTRFTAIAVERDGAPVFLHTHDTNQVARYLIENNMIPPLKGATVKKAEVPVGRNRFDFLLERREKDIFLEVKSCTLFGNGVAMFPDAVTERGRRHVLELAEMGRGGIQAMVLFLVHSSKVTWFMPDFHTDFSFSTALLAARKHVHIVAAALGWQKDLSLDERIRIPKIPWKYLENEIKDRGSYLLVVRLDKKRAVKVGGLGTLRFQARYYLYVGSAMKHLTARINRHQRKGKKPHWHIDYLTEIADHVLPIPVRSSQRLECAMAQAVSAMAQSGPAGFGSSDCHCGTHLFSMENNPLHSPAFHQMLQGFRMRSPNPGK